MALSVIFSVPVSGPAAVGVKVTLIVQLDPAATLVPQVLVSPKSPVTVMPEMASGSDPEFVRVTACDALVVSSGWLPKLRLPGDTPGAGLAPVPESVASCGLSAASFAAAS